MEYEMKISEYGSAIENSDMYSESIRRAFAQKLTEAKKQAVKAKDDMKKKEKALDEEKSSTGGEIDRSKKGVTKHKENPNRFSDEEHTEPKSQAKSKSAAEKAGDKAHDKAQEKDSKSWGKANPGKQTIMKGGVKSTNEGSIQGGVWTADAPKKGAPNVPVPSPNEGPTSSAKRPVKPGTTPEKAKLDPRYKTDPAFKKEVDAASQIGVREGKKPDFLDMDKDGNKKEPMKKAVADKKAGPQKGVNPFAKVKEAADKCNHTAKGKSCPVHGLKECGGMYEGDKFDPLKHVEKKSQTPPIKQAAKDVDRKSYGARTALMKAGGVKDDRGPRGVTQG
jgi:hypothetical protein